jgi:hypothetical protein
MENQSYDNYELLIKVLEQISEAEENNNQNISQVGDEECEPE